MYRKTLAILLASATLAACGSRPENPVDYVTYRDEPLVKQVEHGMTMQKVIAIGGNPSNASDLPHGGTCNDYILNHDGKQQPYYVRFDATGHVDAKGFKTCKQREEDRQAVPGA
ncbi:osmotically-inducible lipoprotein OsmE [Pseudomonas entomophila]|uniref:osmotically-inducible lipoprotein OsmE n=1 Tax=Pseudomonas entomophila TaxID=312306 RepID=UPI0023D8B365|nr:osmotically-inducible lipoprotein OsmE [Pseudomonas entomophila]MDF0733802.1 osmotically-inducible lipoprotein OsmE [Pseudomonas entomophila]